MVLGGNTPKQSVANNSRGDAIVEVDNGNVGNVSSSTLNLWISVANGIDKSQTVVWKNAVNSLEEANRYLLTSLDARKFVEGYMRPVISILLEQQPSKIGPMEKSCVEDSLRMAVLIIVEDLRLKVDPAAGDSTLLDVLAMIFNRKKIFYKGSKPNWNVNLVGMPEVRQQTIMKFQAKRGFFFLSNYLSERADSERFPNADFLHQVLMALVDIIPNQNNNMQDNVLAKHKVIEEEAIRLAHAVMDYMGNASEDSLKRQAHESLNSIRFDVQRIFERLAPSRRKEVYVFYEFWRNLALKLITSKSLPLRLFGWEQVGDIIESSTEMRPPPESFLVSGAGHAFVNGRYVFAGNLTEDGFFKPGSEISYVRRIPASLPQKDGGGKTLTLFRCTMRSHQKWWFLSEADEEQPGTDKDIDYYQHKSKSHEEAEPPPSGWTTCRNSLDPPPTLQSYGLMVPIGEEYNTLEHQLAKWAIQNGVIELVLGASVHREVVARSTPLIKFLASMCERDDAMGEDNVSTLNGLVPNAFCLKVSHLLLAWKTCTSKADAAVSAEVYQLLVSILPLLPNSLAIPLLTAIQESLRDSVDEQDYLFEVAEFCSALASMNEAEVDNSVQNANSMIIPVLTAEVRAEALKLVWEIMTHQDSSSLKSYERLKNFVKNELKVEPLGRSLRETFLGSCKEALNANAKITSSNPGCPIDEAFALRMVKLTRFILEASPKNHTVTMVTTDNAFLANLLFQELTAYLKRYSAELRKMHKGSNSTCQNVDGSALTERLDIVRYAYGLSDKADMKAEQLDILWNLCTQPNDREALMIFLANASNSEYFANTRLATDDMLGQPQSTTVTTDQVKESLRAAFSEKVRLHAFHNLFCAPSLDWEELGDGAYQSFQLLNKSLRRSNRVSSANNFDVDALWRICLNVGNDDVATKAMNDLLSVYLSIGTPSIPVLSYSDAISRPGGSVSSSSNTSNMMTNSQGDSSESFGKRAFEYLSQVKHELESGKVCSVRSAERCLKILNAAVRSSNGGDENVASLSHLSMNSTCVDILQSLPHGMRGQSCYRTIRVQATRVAQQQNHAMSNGVTINSSGGNQGKMSKVPNVDRFSMDVHPFETLASIKTKIAQACKHPRNLVKPITLNPGVRRVNGVSGDNGKIHLNSNNNVFEDSTVAQLGITDGCEVIVILAHNPFPQNSNSLAPRALLKKSGSLKLSDMISNDGPHESADLFFETLMAVLEALPSKVDGHSGLVTETHIDTHTLVWDLLLAMPTNRGIIDEVLAAGSLGSTLPDNDAMQVETPRRDKEWTSLVNEKSYYRSVYICQVLDSFLQPAPEILSGLTDPLATNLRKRIISYAQSFRICFIQSGGFDAVLRLFTRNRKSRRVRMGNAVALRILKCCIFGNPAPNFRKADSGTSSTPLDESGKSLMGSLSDRKVYLESLISSVVDDNGVSDSAILNIIQLLRLLLADHRMIETFVTLPNHESERFLMTLLLWERPGTFIVTSEYKVRKCTHDLILSIPALASRAFPWLIRALLNIDNSSEGTNEFFSALRDLVENQSRENSSAGGMPKHLKDLATAVCHKLSTYPRPSVNIDLTNSKPVVLCGCLHIIRTLIDNVGGSSFKESISSMMEILGTSNWEKQREAEVADAKGLVDMITSPFRPRIKSEDGALMNLMGAIFDGFLSSAGSSSLTPICYEKHSRQLGFDVVAVIARSIEGGEGYFLLASRIKEIVAIASPSLRHRWSHSISGDDGQSRSHSTLSKYSGLRNQGCTCYMNSVLQQLFMMPGLRKNLCSSALPSSLRSSGRSAIAKGAELVGKKIAVHWESGVSYDANVEAFDPLTGMHTIRYSPLSMGTGQQGNLTGGNAGHQQVQPQQRVRTGDMPSIPEELKEEFFLSEGRPGKETGVFDIVLDNDMDGLNAECRVPSSGESSRERKTSSSLLPDGIEESEDEASSRRLLEEVQRTFVHLEECSKGRCFDPRSLVEASGCLKLEFDVWQQNDASEFAMKLLDRLEVPLKKWSPQNFKCLESTFGLKQAKQKICKKCGLKTNREENLMNIDCQIRGKADIHEALSTMCEVELMEGTNKVFCDRCKINCDTVLRTAISNLPDMLILSLKRFDLDYNTFETVKLNSRCAFGETLNMKRYTLEGLEAMEKIGSDDGNVDGDVTMHPAEDNEKGTGDEATSDEDYEYNLVGVLVHAGVAQGGHYYSFIKDRSPNENEEEFGKWYRFDDEDVTAFNPDSIELECFGGKVKQEKKLLNGQVQTIESEQFANALMLFYEKVIPNKIDENGEDDNEKNCQMDAYDVSSGYDVFQPDVQRSNRAHSWHAFLFTSEFQSFLKGILGKCLCSSSDSMDISSPLSSPSSNSTVDDTQSNPSLAVLQISLVYVFDILLHSADVEGLQDWTNKLTDALKQDSIGARWFVHELARRSVSVSSNWMRIYCTDCPDELARNAAVDIIGAAVTSCATIIGEQRALENWIEACTLQFDTQKNAQNGTGAVPFCLEGNWKKHEDLSGLDDSSSSSIGILISFLSLLLDHGPRSWRCNSELCKLIGHFANVKPHPVGSVMRRALIIAQIPARLICLATRERSPVLLRNAFPGASLSHEMAETLQKNETLPSSHLLPLDGGAVGMGSNTSHAGNVATVPSPCDNMNLLESVACLIGVPGAKREVLVVESESTQKIRTSFSLSPAARDALSTIFHESRTSDAGMGHKDIEMYMQLCGVDASTVPPQKIASILNKYPTATTTGDNGKNTRVLSLEGFLAYYRDTAQTNEAQVRSDLHTFGFRPDLSRRQKLPNERYQSIERVTFDVMSSFGDRETDLGHFAESGLLSFQFHSLAYSICEPLAECLLATVAFGKDTNKLLIDALKALSRTPTGWAGTEGYNACLMIFKTLVAIPDERQVERIQILMQCEEKCSPNAEVGVGLLVAAEEFSRLSVNQHYPTDFHYSVAIERYINAVKELLKLKKVEEWMSKNKKLWEWMNRWFRSDSLGHQHIGSDLSGRRDDTVHSSSAGLSHHRHLESEMGPVIGNTSESDDSRCDQIIVQGAGEPAVNGTYRLLNSFDNVGKYMKEGSWQGREHMFSLFRCKLSNNSRRWYISIVPLNLVPGTNKDTDFYSVLATGEENETPPERNWTTAKDHGLDPPPICTTRLDGNEEEEEEGSEDNGRMWNGQEGNNENLDGQNRELGFL